MAATCPPIWWLPTEDWLPTEKFEIIPQECWLCWLMPTKNLNLHHWCGVMMRFFVPTQTLLLSSIRSKYFQHQGFIGSMWFLNYMQTFLLNELRLGGSWWYITYCSSLKICMVSVLFLVLAIWDVCSTSLISLNYNLNTLTSPLASLPYLSVGVSNKNHLSFLSYCWLKKCCTTWHVWNPVNNGIYQLMQVPSTVSHPAQGERSFHIFYQALAAANGGDEEINLEGFQGYRADARLLFWGV